MLKRVTAVTVMIVFVASCAIVKPVPVDQIATVHLCYELITGSQRRGVVVSQELQRRDESCDKYQAQVALMIQDRARRKVEIMNALDSAQQNFNNTKSPIDIYIESQKSLRPQPVLQTPKITNCTSRNMNGTVLTQCM